MHSLSLHLRLATPDDTTALAQALAPYLSAGDTLLLSGDIGAGKSHFARSLIQHILGYAEDVPSPTFTLVQTYETPDFDIWHCDLYRLTSPDEAIELGLDQAFEDSICLIEWPDRLAELEPKSALSLKFAANADHHSVDIAATDARWSELETALG